MTLLARRIRLVVIVTVLEWFGAASAARDPETSCANLDANRRFVKTGLAFFDSKAGLWTAQTKERTASCDLRANNRTVFQRYEASKVAQRGFFLQGKRSGRWTEPGSVMIYADGIVIQENPKSQCDFVAVLGAAIMAYCPRPTTPADMLSDFSKWFAALNLNRPRVVFDVYSSEEKTPASQAAFDAFSEHSDINFPVFQFTKGQLTELMCIPPRETKLRATQVQVTALAMPGLLVEIEVTAVIGSPRSA